MAERSRCDSRADSSASYRHCARSAGSRRPGSRLGSSAVRLWEHLSAEWRELTAAGCNPVPLRERSLVSPACGLAGHDEAQADLILNLTGQVAQRVSTLARGMRLTVGA